MYSAALVGVLLSLFFTGLMAVYIRQFPANWRLNAARQWSLTPLMAALLGIASYVFGALTAAGLLAIALLIASPVLVKRLQRARAIEGALDQLADPALREAKVAELDRLLGPPKPESLGKERKRGRMVQHLAARASIAGFPEIALRWLDTVDGARLDPLSAAALAQATAACCISVRDRARARRELARIRRPVANAMWERGLDAVDILLESLDGDATQAEGRARTALATTKEPTLRATLHCALAHALATAEQRDAAIESLEQMLAVGTPRALERVVRQGGPASPLAERMMTERGIPYR